MRPLVVAIVSAVALLSGACNEQVSESCPVSAGASATCAEACEHLADIDCRPAPTEEECVTTCTSASAGLPADVLNRALACYVAAETCGEVEGCSRSCGAGDDDVPWSTLDAGADAGAPDAGAPDAG